ncbi:flavodoxin family protein [Nocardia sp. NPDC058176]|uniref:flavodoxin family protein n=1 Tax=Nocardia sp. NPDC058176 TaxID=3346368 RepID=UPI0036DC93ED
MKVVIVCKSVSHGNTQRVAEAMAGVLDARIVTPDQVRPGELADYDLVGFGSGIYNMNFHRDLRKFVAALPGQQRGRAFVFSSSGFPEPPLRRYAHDLARRIEGKGFEVVDIFGCRGFDTWLPLRVIGGIRKGHPDAADLAAARAFAEKLQARTTSTS